MKRALLVTVVAASAPVHAQVAGQYDLICKHMNTANVVNGKLEMLDARPARDRHYTIDLPNKRWCLRDKEGFCSTTTPLTYDGNHITLSEAVSINRRDGVLVAIWDRGDNVYSDVFDCTPTTFTPFPALQF